MAKDPAFLFYSNDFDSKTKFLSNEQVGKLIRLMIAQHQHGHLTKKQVEFVCGGFDEELMCKFQIDSDDKYYNDRLDDEILRRVKYSESRRKNVSSRYKPSHEGSHVETVKPHMETETEIETLSNESKQQYSTSINKTVKSDKDIIVHPAAVMRIEIDHSGDNKKRKDVIG